MCGYVGLRSAIWLMLAVIAVSPVTSRADQSDPAIIEHGSEEPMLGVGAALARIGQE